MHTSFGRDPIPLSRREFLQLGWGGLAFGLRPASSPSPEAGLERLTFATNWYAQAEHGGFYQALALGFYREVGLEVSIQMGGTGINILQLLAGGAVDLAMGSSLDVLAALDSGIPVVTVAAIFQKDPQCLLAHPQTGGGRLENLRGKPTYVSPGANLTYWPFLRKRFGFLDEQRRPYYFSLGPFLQDPEAVQQGYLTAEPWRVKREAGFEPEVYLLADYGYNPYATTIETTWSLVNRHPDRVQRFVDASIRGWQSYLEDPHPGNQLIRQANPEMPEELLIYGLDSLLSHQIITGGEAASLGIGAMTDQRWQAIVATMSDIGLFRPTIPYQQAYTLQFLEKGSRLA
ncbi:MAG: ABC transporter substrate-binding protein [Cyanobacteriota bacterium]|nr:ABC transporter substrate-binding protein [Cyanobacteriota bacterium]